MKDAAQFKFDIKSAIDKSLSASFGASLKAALEHKTTRNRAFVYEIDLNGLDEASKPALQAALSGRLYGSSPNRRQFKGIKSLDSALTVTATDTHTLALHFLGIFNAASISEFIAKSKIDFTSDTHELVLSDETLQVVDNNLDAEKLRKLVLKDITLTLPASANTPDVEDSDHPRVPRPRSIGQPVADAPVRECARIRGRAQRRRRPGAAEPETPQLWNVLAVPRPESRPAQCKQLFLDANGKSHDWMYYLDAMCAAERIIYAGLAADPENAYHLEAVQCGSGHLGMRCKMPATLPN